MHRLYFSTLFRKNKFLFAFVFLFFIVNIVANVFVVTEITPVYNWNLYATPIENQNTYSFLKVKYNGTRFLRFKHTWEEPNKLLFTNTMNLFVALQVKKETDPTEQYYKNDWLPRHSRFHEMFKKFRNYNNDEELGKFPQWYKKILQQKEGESINEIDVYETHVQFRKDGSVNELSSKHIYSYNEP